MRRTKLDTTQEEKDIVGTEGTKESHSGQKEAMGTFEVFFVFRRFSRVWNTRASFQISIHETSLLWVINFFII